MGLNISKNRDLRASSAAPSQHVPTSAPPPATAPVEKGETGVLSGLRRRSPELRQTDDAVRSLSSPDARRATITASQGKPAEREVTRPTNSLGGASGKHPASAGSATYSHGKKSELAEQMAREVLDTVRVGKLARELNPALLDSVHSLAYEKDEKYETLQGRLTPGYLLARARGKHSIQPAEKRESWAAAPGGLDMRTYDHSEIANVQSYGASFAGVPLPGANGSGGRRMGKTVFRSASEINADLAKLCWEVKTMLGQKSNSTDPMDAARIAAHFKQHFIAIHPYMDANGRVSRLVAERILKEFHLPPPDWSAAEYGLNLSVEDAARLMIGKTPEAVRGMPTRVRE